MIPAHAEAGKSIKNAAANKTVSDIIMDKENSILPVFKLAMEDVRTANLKECADRLELEYDEGIHLDFLLQSYVVTNKGVFKESGEQASQIISALLIQYCLSNTKSRPTGNFVSISQLAGPGSGIGGYFTNEFLIPMDKKFSNDIEKLERAAFKLAAKKANLKLIIELDKNQNRNKVYLPKSKINTLTYLTACFFSSRCWSR